MEEKVPGLSFKYIYGSVVVLVMLMMAGLFGSRFLISLSTIGLCLPWLIHPGKKDLLIKSLGHPVAISASIILLVVLASGIYSRNASDYLVILLNKLPYFFIPLSILSVPVFSEQIKMRLTQLLIFLLLVSGVYTAFHFFNDRQAILDAYTRGQILPTVMHHVSYSLLLVIGVLLCADQIIKHIRTKERLVIAAYAIAALLLTILIHILATRTGIILLYLCLPLYLLSMGIRERNYKTTGILFALFVIAGAIGLSRSETWERKVAYMRYDLSLMRQNRNADNQLSDARRLLTDSMGFSIWKQNLWTGVGIGDVRNEVEKRYEKYFPQYPKDTHGHIHSQYLLVFAGCGLIGGSLFIGAMFLPVWYHFRNGEILLGVVALALFLVLWWEPFLMYQHGNTIYLLVLVAGLQKHRKT